MADSWVISAVAAASQHFLSVQLSPRWCDGLITGAASCFEMHSTDFSMWVKEVRMWCLAWGHSLQSCPFIAWIHIPRFTGQKVSEENIPIITDTGLAFCYFFPSLQALAKTAGHPKSTWKASAAAQRGFPRFIFLLYGTSKGAFDQSPTYQTHFGDPLKKPQLSNTTRVFTLNWQKSSCSYKTIFLFGATVDLRHQINLGHWICLLFYLFIFFPSSLFY